MDEKPAIEIHAEENFLTSSTYSACLSLASFSLPSTNLAVTKSSKAEILIDPFC